MVQSDIGKLKEFIEKLKQSCIIKSATFCVMKSQQIYVITETEMGFCAYYVNEFSRVDQIGKLRYIIKNDGFYVGYIQSTLVGEGIGTELMKKAVELAKSRGCERLYLRSYETAKKFYEKLGFVEGKKDKHDLTEYSINLTKKDKSKNCLF